MSDKKNDSDIQITEINKNPDAPLVVDLPDGQKLMVGQLPPGTVVEIATWRGTNRPDSRTTRLLLGVSSQTNEEQPEESQMVSIKTQSRRKRREKRSIFSIRWQGVLLFLLTISILVGAFIVSPLRIVNPTLGSSIGFGSAESSLIITTPISDPKIGTPVLAYLGDNKSAIVFGTLSQMAENEILIQTSSGFAQTDKENLIGRSLLVIPLLGKLF